MNPVSMIAQQPHSAGLWLLAWRRLKADTTAMISLAVVAVFLLIISLSAAGFIAADWDAEIAVSYAPPGWSQQAAKAAGPATDESAALPDNPYDPLREDILQIQQQLKGAAPQVDWYGVQDPLATDIQAIYSDLAKQGGVQESGKKESLLFGADKWGHDVLKKTIKGAETSIVVGIVAAVLATVLGTVFGALAGYFGGRTDDFFNWFYSIFTAIPYLLLILAVAAVLQQKGVGTIILILALTGWTGPFRLMRAEYLKHKNREYVWAAQAIGASHWRKMAVHIFPNVSHVALVQISILVVGFIKSEVILSFLGFGVPVGTVSWGSILNEAQNELILGKWWQLTAATVAMATLVTAFSLFTDALRDALDPKLR